MLPIAAGGDLLGWLVQINGGYSHLWMVSGKPLSSELGPLCSIIEGSTEAAAAITRKIAFCYKKKCCDALPG